MSEMIERVALALVAEDPVPMSMFTADDVRALARAAVEAMCEPTEAMLDEGALPLPPVENECSPTIRNMRDDAKMIWTSMINAALEPTP